MANEIVPLLEVVVRKGTGAVNRERVRKLKKEADSFILVGWGNSMNRLATARRTYWRS